MDVYLIMQLVLTMMHLSIIYYMNNEYIKIKTQLDSSFFSAGEPFFFGGDGPDAIYYDSNKIIRDPQELELFTKYTAGEIVLSNGIRCHHPDK